MRKDLTLPNLWRRFLAGRPDPGLLRWSFGGEEFASPISARSSYFRAWFEPSLPRGEYFFRQEIFRAVQKLEKRRGGKKIGLCFSGGVDSELIARALAQAGIPFEMHFLDLWGLNAEGFGQYAPPLERALGQKVRVHRLERDFFYEQHSPATLKEFGCELPTYIALTYLFEKVPSDQFLLVGDGDLNRTGALDQLIRRQNSNSREEKGVHLPFSFASVFYQLWARSRARAGEFYFFRSTPELLAATLADPLFLATAPAYDTRPMIYAAFPEILPRPKTTNWDTPQGEKENRWIRNWLLEQMAQTEASEYWQPGMGAMVNVDNIFRPGPLSS